MTARLSYIALVTSGTMYITVEMVTGANHVEGVTRLTTSFKFKFKSLENCYFVIPGVTSIITLIVSMKLTPTNHSHLVVFLYGLFYLGLLKK